MKRKKEPVWRIQESYIFNTIDFVSITVALNTRAMATSDLIKPESVRTQIVDDGCTPFLLPETEDVELSLMVTSHH